MNLLTNYEQFLARVEALGFMALSNTPVGLPSLSDETPNHLWHTGDRDSDPWQWKDRAAAEKRLAYGCILGGSKGFITARFYAAFYTACRHPRAMQDRWLAGELNQTIWQLWQVFQRQGGLTTGEVRKAMGVSAKSGASRVDTALVQLQKEFGLTVTGSRRKVSKAGKEYGWANNVYERVERWVPPEWLDPAREMNQAGARAKILDAAQAMDARIDPQALASFLWE